jgi:hypothetical protein
MDTSDRGRGRRGWNKVVAIAAFIYGVEEVLGYMLLTNGADRRAMVRAFGWRVCGRELRR